MALASPPGRPRQPEASARTQIDTGSPNQLPSAIFPQVIFLNHADPSNAWIPMNPDQQTPWPWPKTFGIYLGLTLVFFISYLLLQRSPFFPIWTVPQLPGESSIPFVPHATVIYLSIVLLMPLAPLLLPDRQSQRRYFCILTILNLVELACFAFFPSRIDRPEVSSDTSLLWVALQQCDTDGNAFPSLHAALAVFCAGAIQICGRSWCRWIWLWCVSILVSILLVKQHRILDVLSGSLLGGLATWIFLRKKA